MDAQEDMHMNDYNKITALYSRLSVGDEETAFRNSFGLPTDPFPTLLRAAFRPLPLV